MVQEISRRDILNMGVATVGVGGLASISATASATTTAAAAPSLWAVAELVPPESRAFAASFGRGKLVPVSADMNELFDRLSGDLPAIVVGLTSDPVEMVAEQLLLARGARQLFRWVHRYQGGAWHHDIDSGVTAADLGRQAGAQWPAGVARLAAQRLDVAAQGTSTPQTVCTGTCRLPRRSPGLLVSWAWQTTGTI